MTDLLIRTTSWTDVCDVESIPAGRGACALVDGMQVAIFRVDDEVFSVSNFDPFSGAFVISRGIVGNRGDVIKVASPMFKQSFDLGTGACLDDPSVALDTFDVRVRDGRIEVRIPCR